jgi:hypothetical protein
MVMRLEQRTRRAARVRFSTALTLVLMIAVTLGFLTFLTRGLVTPRNGPKAFQGYTLIAPLQSTKTYLIDMQGQVVHMWESDYAAGQDAYLLEDGHLLRAGKLTSEEQLFSGPAAGGRVQEFTWDGELVWDFKFHNAKQVAHHDVARLPNGHVLLIGWELKTAEETIAAGRRPEAVDGPWLVDSVFEIRPAGKTAGEVVWEWHAWDHLIQDRDPSKANYGDVAAHPELIDINFGQDLFSLFSGARGTPEKEANTKDVSNTLRSLGYLGPPSARGDQGMIRDWTHVNAVAYNAERDRIMLTVPTFHEIWIIDHSTTTAEAAGHTGGRSGKGGDLLYRWGNPQAYRAGTKADQRFFAHHDAHWIPPGRPGAGHVLVFNNGLGRPGGECSSVDEIVLPVESRGQYPRPGRSRLAPDESIWSYTAPRKPDFFAFFMSGADRLPNGNTLICNGVNGTIFEVTWDKQVVWIYNYVGTARSGPGGSGPPSDGSGGQPRPGEILASSLRDLLAMSPEQRKDLDELQKEVDSGLDQIFTEAQKRRLREGSGFGRGGIGGLALPGQIMSLSRQLSLKPTAEQKKRLTELRDAVDDKLAKLLTADQRARFQKLKDDFGRTGPPGLRRGGRPGFGPGRGFAVSRGPRGRNSLFRAYRYGPDYPGLAGKELNPGKTVEELEAE